MRKSTLLHRGWLLPFLTAIVLSLAITASTTRAEKFGNLLDDAKSAGDDAARAAVKLFAKKTEQELLEDAARVLRFAEFKSVQEAATRGEVWAIEASEEFAVREANQGAWLAAAENRLSRIGLADAKPLAKTLFREGIPIQPHEFRAIAIVPTTEDGVRAVWKESPGSSAQVDELTDAKSRLESANVECFGQSDFGIDKLRAVLRQSVGCRPIVVAGHTIRGQLEERILLLPNGERLAESELHRLAAQDGNVLLLATCYSDDLALKSTITFDDVTRMVADVRGRIVGPAKPRSVEEAAAYMRAALLTESSGHSSSRPSTVVRSARDLLFYGSAFDLSNRNLLRNRKDDSKNDWTEWVCSSFQWLQLAALGVLILGMAFQKLKTRLF